ncbi:MAG: hypothetical protein AAF481_08710 [Acidobacteriota bacterium]
MSSSPWTDDELRAMLFEAEPDAPSLSDCPDADSIRRAAALELPRDEMRGIVDHASQCPACTRAWGLALNLGARSKAEGMSLQSEDKAAAVSMPVGPGDLAAEPETSFPSLSLVAAALSFVVVAMLLIPTFTKPDRVRGPSELTSTLGADSVLTSDEAVLRWQGMDKAERFNLQVSWTTAEASGLVKEVTDVPAAKSGETTYRLTEDDLREVPSGARILWRVAAKSGGGLDEKLLGEKTFTARFVRSGSTPPEASRDPLIPVGESGGHTKTP